MTAYAIALTLLFGIVIGVVGHVLFEDWSDNRYARKFNNKNSAPTPKSGQSEMSDETDDAMNEAVELVKDKLGGEILSYEKVD